MKKKEKEESSSSMSSSTTASAPAAGVVSVGRRNITIEELLSVAVGASIVQLNPASLHALDRTFQISTDDGDDAEEKEQQQQQQAAPIQGREVELSEILGRGVILARIQSLLRGGVPEISGVEGRKFAQLLVQHLNSGDPSLCLELEGVSLGDNAADLLRRIYEHPTRESSAAGVDSDDGDDGDDDGKKKKKKKKLPAAFVQGLFAAQAVFALLSHFLETLNGIADGVAGLSCEAQRVHLHPFGIDFHDQSHPQKGKIQTALHVREMLQRSVNLETGGQGRKYQDPPAFQLIPAVHGAFRDHVTELCRLARVELKSSEFGHLPRLDPQQSELYFQDFQAAAELIGKTPKKCSPLNSPESIHSAVLQLQFGFLRLGEISKARMEVLKPSLGPEERTLFEDFQTSEAQQDHSSTSLCFSDFLKTGEGVNVWPKTFRLFQTVWRTLVSEALLAVHVLETLNSEAFQKSKLRLEKAEQKRLERERRLQEEEKKKKKEQEEQEEQEGGGEEGQKSLPAAAAEDKKSRKQQKKKQKKKKQDKAGGGGEGRGGEAKTPKGLRFGNGVQKFLAYLDLFDDHREVRIFGSPEKYLEIRTFLEEIKFRIHRPETVHFFRTELWSSENVSQSRPKIPKGTRDALPLQMAIREHCFRLIKGIFRRHGAVGIDTPVFERRETLMGKYGEDSKLIYDLADQGGESLSLRYDLTVPFARFCATHDVQQIKRYHIGKVYRRDQPQMKRGRFREFYQCDLDIAGEYELMTPDSEVLKILTDVLEGLQLGEFKIKLNHRNILDGLMAACGVPEDKFRTICSAVDKLDKEPWAAVKREMVGEKGLEEAVADRLGAWVTRAPDPDPETTLRLLESEPLFQGNKSLESGVHELRLLFRYLEAFRCTERISFDLSLARGLDYYTGLIYEAVLLDREGRVVGGSIAAGGRYDELVGMFSGRRVPAVGVSIGIERILAMLEQRAAEKEKKKKDEKEDGQRMMKIREKETEVLVCSAAPGLLRARMELCAELWQTGVNAEFFHHRDPKSKRQMTYALEHGIPCLVFLKPQQEEKEKTPAAAVDDGDDGDGELPAAEIVEFRTLDEDEEKRVIRNLPREDLIQEILTYLGRSSKP